MSHREESFVFENKCVYARVECFLRWKEESIKRWMDEATWKRVEAMVQERNGK
jgi:hypothetical protein